MAYWGRRKQPFQIENVVTKLGDGENTFLSPFDISRSESVESRNLSSTNYPALSVRKGRQHLATAITTPNGLGAYRGEHLHVLDGAIWKRWDGAAWQNIYVLLANSRANFIEFNTETDNYIIVAEGTATRSFDGTNWATMTQAPATILYAVDDYRLYALIGNVLKCSATGSLTDWTTANDADSITLVGSVGTERAIISYKDTIICFFDKTMHVLYGNDPYDFYMNDPIEYGCIGDRALIKHNGKLYFLNYDAVYVYTGGRPTRISDKVKTYIDGINSTYKNLCAMGKHGKYIYISIPYGTATTNNLTLEYDTELNMWYPHSVGYLAFVNIGNSLCGIDSDGQTWTLNSGTDDNGVDISSYWISGVIDHKTLSLKKILSDIWFSVDLPVGSTLSIYYSTTVDNDDFTLLSSLTANANEQTTRVQVPTSAIQGVNYYRLKLVIEAPCTIHAMEEKVRVKSR